MENSWLLEMVQWKEQKEMRRKNNKVCAAALWRKLQEPGWE